MTRCLASLYVACLLAFAPAASADGPSETSSKDILGWIEWVDIGRGPLRLKAKLDTGATTSSLTAEDIEVFKKDGKRYVRFVVRDEDHDVEESFESRLVRHVRIRRHDGSTQRRPVVEIGMCLGSVYRKQEFTLVDRSSFVYPVLVGRNFMEGRIIVDPGDTFIQRPSCRRQSRTRSAAADAVAVASA
ncbi:ATP-dependent zinc protease family protein [Marilutibacter chinensis]|uniref:ATP-dependent zinc protease n=1 Tax=Marilutibacter chinensis TaxID=2912247 RepID=A0ABS9HR05_9GAMM|nr:ATP-dependent zinc protease [Lysobacter chinensis]MCF7221361.1 ATP-dependent zinc protease [Lysobacter chinensis]